MNGEMNKYLVLTGVATTVAMAYCWMRMATIVFESFDRRLVGG